MNPPRRSSHPAAENPHVADLIVEARGVEKTYRRGETEVQALRGTDLGVGARGCDRNRGWD